MAKINKAELANQTVAHKQNVADEVYALQLSTKINKSHNFGTTKVENAKISREESKIEESKNEET